MTSSDYLGDEPRRGGLTIIIPSRGRPKLLTETVNIFLAAITEPDTRILLCLDDDDDTNVAFADPRVIVSIKPREDTRGLKYERALTEAPAELYLVGVDHTPIHTRGFDRMFLEAGRAFPDGIGCVCTPMANASFPFLQALTRRWVEISGFVQPPQFPFWFIDHWTDDVARMTGRYRMVDVKVESDRRPAKTTGLRDLYFWAPYYDALADDRRAQANRLIDAMDEPAWQKQALRDSFPMHEFRSQWINQQVVALAGQIEESRGNKETTEGYIRAMRNAVNDMHSRWPEEKAA